MCVCLDVWNVSVDWRTMNFELKKTTWLATCGLSRLGIESKCHQFSFTFDTFHIPNSKWIINYFNVRLGWIENMTVFKQNWSDGDKVWIFHKNDQPLLFQRPNFESNFVFAMCVCFFFTAIVWMCVRASSWVWLNYMKTKSNEYLS